MKRLLITAAALLVTLSIQAQGIMDFQNTASSLLLNANEGNAPVDGTGADSDGIVVGLYWASLTAPDVFTQIGGSAPVGVPVSGRFSGGNRTTGPATAPGAQARFQVRAWELSYGSTYELAIVAPAANGRRALAGTSNIFQTGTGDGGQIPPQPLTGLQGFTVIPVPEPSTIALGVIGAGALLLLRRRK